MPLEGVTKMSKISITLSQFCVVRPKHLSPSPGLAQTCDWKDRIPHYTRKIITSENVELK